MNPPSSPEIKPGFTLETVAGGYIVSYKTKEKEQKQKSKISGGSYGTNQKTYIFLWIKNSLEELKRLEKRNFSAHAKVEEQEYNISELEKLIKDKGLKILYCEDDFREISNLILHGKSLEHVKIKLINNGMEKLYRKHPYFTGSRKRKKR